MNFQVIANENSNTLHAQGFCASQEQAANLIPTPFTHLEQDGWKVCRKCRNAVRRHKRVAGKRVSLKRERILDLRVTKNLALDNYQRTRNMHWAREARGIDAYLAGDRKNAVKLLIAAGW